MKHTLYTLAFFLISSSLTLAQNKQDQDRQAIKSMCGCFDVSFNFSETFSYSDDESYKPSEVKHSKGLEWVELVMDDNHKLVLQHLLIVGPPEKQKVIKHWRQDWLYENTDLYLYNADNNWTYSELNKESVKGQWTQKVYQVDDSPRYEGTATWVHVDGVSRWENTTDAPLPRREYTKRSDYNVTRRNNVHRITPEGWVHDQDNDKIIRKPGEEDVILAQEKGINIYKKAANSRCKPAIEWWKENGSKWATVRDKWDEIFARRQDLDLRSTLEEKPLHRYLMAEDFEFSEDHIDGIIEKFIVRK